MKASDDGFSVEPQVVSSKTEQITPSSETGVVIEEPKEQVEKPIAVVEKMTTQKMYIADDSIEQTKEKTDWVESTRQKRDWMVSQGMSTGFAHNILDGCKAHAKEIGRCVDLATHLWIHESGRGQSNAAINYNNPFGFMRGGKHIYFDTTRDSFLFFLDRFNKYRHPNNCREMITRSKYTMTQKEERINTCEWTITHLNHI